ncbi:hypothetical protein KBD49_03870 [Myxococcota bacterium]|nr:hypothetical protein [Myxococcota bacterium]
MRRLAWLPGLLWILVPAAGCDSTSAPSIPVIRRPLSLAVTCASQGGEPIALGDCADREGVWTSWALDGDARGLVVAHGSSTDRFDADPFIPGWTPVALDGDGVSVRAGAGSDRVYVAIRRDDIGNGPAIAWVEPRLLVPWMRLPRAALPCDPAGMEIGPVVGMDGKTLQETLVIPSACDGTWTLILLPVSGLSRDGALLPEHRRIPLSARPLGVSIAPGGKILYAALREDDRDVVERIDLEASDMEAGRVRTVPGVAVDSPRGEVLPGCDIAPWDRTRAFRLGGAPSPSPDGRFLYLPLEAPHGVMVLQAEDLQLIDVQASQPLVPGSGNDLLGRLGIRYLPMSAPVRGVAFFPLPEPEDPGAEDAEKGLRAYAILESGLAVRLVVDPERPDQALHRIDPASTDVESVATMPVTIEGEDLQPLGIVRRPEWPSFGMSDIQSDPERPGRSIYYGIRFHDDPSQELSESWDVVYEGVLPHATGCGTFRGEIQGGEVRVFEDPSQDFCELGVSEGEGDFPGDHLVIRPDPAGGCDLASLEALEYRIVAVEATRLLLEPAFASLPLPPPGCLDGRTLRYEVRASRQWLVVGSTSGLLHNRTSSRGVCVPRGDVSARFTGRALTTMPADGTEVLQACPVRLGDARIGDNFLFRRFENPSFSLNVVPGCRIDSRFRPVVVPPRRDQRLTFQVTSGFQPKSLALGGAPVDFVPGGKYLFVLDAATRSVYQVDSEKHLVSASWY